MSDVWAGWSLNQRNQCPAMAVYGVDIMFDEELNPILLEIQVNSCL